MNDIINNSHPILLNGEIIEYSLVNKVKKCVLKEVYKNGINTSTLIYNNLIKQPFPSIDIYYYDSLFQNIPHSLLYYQQDNNIVLYKQYLNGIKPHQLSDKIFFVKHKDFKSKNRIILGGTFSFGESKDKSLKTKNFFSLGYSKKFLKGTYTDTTGKNYYDNRGNFSSINFTLLGSNTNKTNCLAQKITYSYTLLFIQGEIGIINYTDFKKIDPRLTFGLGLSILGNFNNIFYLSIPLKKQQFADVPNFSVSLTLN